MALMNDDPLVSMVWEGCTKEISEKLPHKLEVESDLRNMSNLANIPIGDSCRGRTEGEQGFEVKKNFSSQIFQLSTSTFNFSTFNFNFQLSTFQLSIFPLRYFLSTCFEESHPPLQNQIHSILNPFDPEPSNISNILQYDRKSVKTTTQFCSREASSIISESSAALQLRYLQVDNEDVDDEAF